MNKNLVEIGHIIKPRGLRGELKCTAPMVKGKMEIYIDNKPHKITGFSEYNNFVYLFLDGVATVEVADRYRNKKIFVDRSLLCLDDDEILTSELVGFDVRDEKGNMLGSIKSIDDHGAGDIIDCGSFTFPYEDEFVVETNVTKREIIIRNIF